MWDGTRRKHDICVSGSECCATVLAWLTLRGARDDQVNLEVLVRHPSDPDSHASQIRVAQRARKDGGEIPRSYGTDAAVRAEATVRT